MLSLLPRSLWYLSVSSFGTWKSILHVLVKCKGLINCSYYLCSFHRQTASDVEFQQLGGSESCVLIRAVTSLLIKTKNVLSRGHISVHAGIVPHAAGWMWGTLSKVGIRRVLTERHCWDSQNELEPCILWQSHVGKDP